LARVFGDAEMRACLSTGSTAACRCVSVRSRVPPDIPQRICPRKIYPTRRSIGRASMTVLSAAALQMWCPLRHSRVMGRWPGPQCKGIQGSIFIHCIILEIIYDTVRRFVIVLGLVSSTPGPVIDVLRLNVGGDCRIRMAHCIGTFFCRCVDKRASDEADHFKDSPWETVFQLFNNLNRGRLQRSRVCA